MVQDVNIGYDSSVLTIDVSLTTFKSYSFFEI